ncbi:MAG: DUF2306 domain-containing protein [Bacteroidota bacterium]
MQVSLYKISGKLAWILFAVLAISISLYPLYYLLADGVVGLLNTKDPNLLQKFSWKTGFYTHIIFGGIALMIGWMQFSKKLRKDRIKLHRRLGKLYVISVYLSSLAGIYIGYHATGGIIAMLGFMLLGLFWFSFTLKAYLDIRKGDINSHERMMIYSYALCFAAVMLRLWMGPLVALMGDFIPAYRIVAWLCWLPNLGVAYWINTKLEKKKKTILSV